MLNVIIIEIFLQLFQINSNLNICLSCQGSQLQYRVQFLWINQEDEAEVWIFDQSLSILVSNTRKKNLIIFQRNTTLVGRIILQETTLSNAWYEVLSVLHLMATLSLSQANLLLLPRTSVDGYQPKVSEGTYYRMTLQYDYMTPLFSLSLSARFSCYTLCFMLSRKFFCLYFKI